MPAANALRLDDGFSTIITLANLPTVKLYEREVTPPGYSAGAPIDTTTMRNTAYRTMAPRKLKNLTKMTSVVAYATDALELVWAQLAVTQLITVTLPDGSSVQFYGWIEEFTPGNHAEGTQPTATLTIQPGMRDLNGVEFAPIYNEPDETSMRLA